MTAAISERSTAASFVRLAVLAALAFGAADSQALSHGNGDLRVMTYNVNEGTDFIEVQQAKGQLEFLLAVGQTIAQIRANAPRERMKAIAHQIVDAGPALISLQEVDRISSGAFNPANGACGPMTLEFDMLRDLLEALAAQGAHYTVAVQQQQYAIPPLPGLLPASGFFCASLVNSVVILTRTDLKSSRFEWGNPQSANYQNRLIFPTPIGLLPLPRAWVSVDATFNGKAFRFIGTHLESADATLRRLQGLELRSGPATTIMPVVIAMDSNAQAAPLPLDATYVDFIGAGYEDAWPASAPPAVGFTCCQAQLSNNVAPQLTQRIDLILTHGPITTQRIELFGADPADKTADGFWPSDHAGVAAQLHVR